MPAGIEVYVPRYNASIRAFAQGRKIPLIDLTLALAGLPNAGLRTTASTSASRSAATW